MQEAPTSTPPPLPVMNAWAEPEQVAQIALAILRGLLMENVLSFQNTESSVTRGETIIHSRFYFVSYCDAFYCYPEMHRLGLCPCLPAEGEAGTPVLAPISTHMLLGGIWMSWSCSQPFSPWSTRPHEQQPTHRVTGSHILHCFQELLMP